MLTVAIDQRPSARIIATHPEVVANQVGANADITPSSSTVSSISKTSEATSDKSEINKLMAEIRVNDEPHDVSKKIFKDKWLAKLESVRSREAKLRDKAEKLVEREQSLDRREKRLAILERQAREKVERAQVYLNRCKEPKPAILEDSLNETYATVSPDAHELKRQTVAKLNPATLPKPNFGSRHLKHVHFQNRPKKVEKNSTELAYIHVSNSAIETEKQTLIKGMHYSSCRVVKNGKENNPTKASLKRNSVSRLSVRSSQMFF